LVLTNISRSSEETEIPVVWRIMGDFRKEVELHYALGGERQVGFG